MAYTSVTYTFANSTTADATQVNQNFTDVLNGLSDGTKDLNVYALTTASDATLGASVTLGASASNTLTINAAVGASIPVGTNTSYDLGSSTKGFRSIYIGASSTYSVRILAGTQSSSWSMTLPLSAGTTGYSYITDGSGVTSWQPNSSPGDIKNYSVAASVSADALTITLKFFDGTSPSSTQPIYLNFRNATAATGTTLTRAVTSSPTLTVPSSATLGTSDGVTAYIWVYALDNSGTVELAISHLRYDEGTIQSTTTISSSATVNNVIYSTTGRSNVAIRLLARLTVNETTAGTWASAPSEISLPDAISPGESIACRYIGINDGANFPTSITYQTKDYDTHTAYSSGTYTVPIAGKYHIAASINMAKNWSSGDKTNLIISRNGTLKKYSVFVAAAFGILTATQQVEDTIDCAKDDTITISTGGGAQTSNDNDVCVLTITKVG